MNESYKDITFLRTQVAHMLDCTPLTIAHREKRGLYPQPARASNNYRVYTLLDVFHLQSITLGDVYVQPILSELWDMGYKDVAELDRIITQARKDYEGRSENAAVQ